MNVESVFQDWRINSGRSRMMMFLFRSAQRSATHRSALAWIWRSAYAIYCPLVVGAELPLTVTAGPRLRIEHGSGLVVHRASRIGADVTLRNGVTLGVKRFGSSEAPALGDGVQIGSNSTILGAVIIGDNAIVGAHSLVIRDVPPNSIVAGVPAVLRGASPAAPTDISATPAPKDGRQ
jgi:putative colanic acid biosynthesis acetyltransferase WcaB